MTRTSDNYQDAILFGLPLPPQNDIEVAMPDGFYICMDCGNTTQNYNKMCSNCESWNGGDGDDD